jgi:ATP-GRASP peptide maturase of grasp-with-spasm system
MAQQSDPEVLVLSQSSMESTTDLVCDYLYAIGIPFLRLNGNDFDAQGGFTLSVADGCLEVVLEPDGAQIDLRQIRAVWYRRWLQHQLFEESSLVAGEGADPYRASHRVAGHLMGELRRVSQALFAELARAKALGEPRTASPSKLHVLKMAGLTGLATPATLVTVRRERVLEFAARYGSIVTKPIGDFEPLVLDGQVHATFTKELTPEVLAELPDRFFPSLFQEKLEKRYELRVFFLAGECYTAAIFSQLDARTQVDWRNHTSALPNRVVPYRLPTAVVASLRDLMSRLELETGSIDLVRTVDGRLVFLEVNPAGQFGMVSQPCNYFLERRVAECLAAKAGHGES